MPGDESPRLVHPDGLPALGERLRPSGRGEAHPEAAPVSRCPRCGCALRLVADVDPGADPPPPLDFDAPPAELAPASAARYRVPRRESGGLLIAQPRPIYRGTGADRERQWGAVADADARPGDRVQVVARSGKTWTATVAAALGAAANGGHLVSLAGAEWQPAPEAEAPADPAWLAERCPRSVPPGAAWCRSR